ncbi:MAG: energy-coupling factor transporter ATPase [Bifidobacteriaceae bacterium]|nr:energy-coupling factor transporter ATPase [Bifidobacteriaceae bacterium]
MTLADNSLEKVAELHNINYTYADGTKALNNISLTIHKGEHIALVGDNGSGKSTLAMLLAGLRSPDSGLISLLNTTVFDTQGVHAHAYRKVREHIGLVLQNPEDQIITTVLQDDVAFGPENLGWDVPAISEQVIKSLSKVDLLDRATDNPIYFSGGQQQRTAIAGIIAMKPKLLIFDEPTAMLDNKAREEVYSVMKELRENLHTTIIHITHRDESIALAHRIIELKNGSILGDYDNPTEYEIQSKSQNTSTKNSTPENYAHSKTPYSNQLEHDTTPIIDIQHVSYTYPHTTKPALSDCNLQIIKGETLILSGENGSGKSTLLRMLCGLQLPTAGSINVSGTYLTQKKLKRNQLHQLRSHIGYVMQHCEKQLFAATVLEDIMFAPKNYGLTDDEAQRQAYEIMRALHIEQFAHRSPFDLSGGQQKLVAIAGVLVSKPDILILDEPTSNLDTHARNLVLDYLVHLQQKNVTIIMTTHNNSDIKKLSARIHVMRSNNAGYSEHLQPSLQPQEVSEPHLQLSPQSHFSPHLQSFEQPQDDFSNIVRHVQSEEQSHALPLIHAQSGEQMQLESHAPSFLHAQTATSALSLVSAAVFIPCVCVLMCLSFLINNVWQLVLSLSATVLLAIMGNIHYSSILQRVKGFLVLFIITGVCSIFYVHTGNIIFSYGVINITDNAVMQAFLYIMRFAIIVCIGDIAMRVKTPTQMTDGCEKILSPLSRLGMHVQDLALVMSLALRFIPTLQNEAHAIGEAQACRGGDIISGSLIKRCKAGLTIVTPMLVSTIRHADNLSIALDARNYTSDRKRTHWHEEHFGVADACAIFFTLTYTIVLILLLWA